MATEVIVTQADIDDLATKLDEFGAVLNDREKAIMIGVLELAGQGVAAAASKAAANPPTPSTTAVPPLSVGFRDAFKQGVGTRFRIDDSAQTESTTVKGGVSVDHTKES
jgi:hypothetical protein